MLHVQVKQYEYTIKERSNSLEKLQNSQPIVSFPKVPNQRHEAVLV